MDTLKTLSEKVRARTTYGLREEVIESKFGYIIAWSNASRKWYMQTLPLSFYTNETVVLDANQVLAYGKKSDIEKMIPDLPELPLYKNSFEAMYKKD